MRCFPSIARSFSVDAREENKIPFMQRLHRSINRAITKFHGTILLRRVQSTAAAAQQTITNTSTNNTTPVTSVKMATSLNADTFLAHIKNRRSYYPLNKELPISTQRIQEIIGEAVQHVPSSFNSQSNRVVVLFGAEHEKFWDLTTEVLKAIVPAEQWEPTGQKMAMFRGAAGTALFFEDQEVVEGLQAKFALYADR